MRISKNVRKIETPRGFAREIEVSGNGFVVVRKWDGGSRDIWHFALRVSGHFLYHGQVAKYADFSDRCRIKNPLRQWK